jgi:hypothetical protein
MAEATSPDCTCQECCSCTCADLSGELVAGLPPLPFVPGGAYVPRHKLEGL